MAAPSTVLRNRPLLTLMFGHCALVNTLTMVDGVPLPRTPERKRMIWIVRSIHQPAIMNATGGL